jgi:hypothetical protein
VLFSTFGPFLLPRDSSGGIDFSRDPKKAFWDTVNAAEDGLGQACGCYVVAASGGRGTLPHYVGLTEGNSFKNECSAPHVLAHFNTIVQSNAKRQPSLFLIAKRTPTGRFSKPAKKRHPDIRFLENYLIALALERNDDLLNKRQTRFLREMKVEGLLNGGQGRPADAAGKLRVMLGR